jgi:hypothetical protein
MFGEQNNDNAMDDAMDDGNIGNMFFSFKKKRMPTMMPNAWMVSDYTNEGPATKPSPTVEPTKEEADQDGGQGLCHQEAT